MQLDAGPATSLSVTTDIGRGTLRVLMALCDLTRRTTCKGYDQKLKPSCDQIGFQIHADSVGA